MNVFDLKRNLLIALPISLLALTTAGSASAATISGIAQIGGALANGVTVSGNSIIFGPGGSGAFVEQAPGTGSFAGVTGGTIKNLVGPPIVGAVSVSKFLTFNGGAVSPIFFDLVSIDPGNGTAAPCAVFTIGAGCTPAGSPFTLTQQNASTVAVTLNVHGFSYDSTGVPLSPTDGGFTTQFVAQGTVQQILAQLQGGGSISASYSATFAATGPISQTPEPSAASLLFAGVALIAGSRVIRRYRQQS